MRLFQAFDQKIMRWCSWDGRLSRGEFLRAYLPLAVAELFLGIIASVISPAIYAWLAWTIFIFIAFLIFFRVIERLRDTGHSWMPALLLFTPFINIYAIWLIFLKKGGDGISKNRSTKESKGKVLVAALVFIALVSTAIGFAPLQARAWHEFGHFEWPKFELPKIELPRLEIPLVGVVLDFNKGLGIIDDVKAQLNNLPDEIEIPGTSFKAYPKQSIERNIVNNIAPMLGEAVGFLDPAKPLASLARTIISKGKPYFDQYIKPHIAPDIKDFFHKTLKFIKDVQKAKDIPIVGGAAIILWDMVVGPIDDLGVELVELLAEEAGPRQVAPCRYCQPISPSPPAPPPVQVVVPEPFVNQIPSGWLDRIDEHGVAYGWARDMNEPDRSIKVRVFIDLFVPGDPLQGSYFTADIDANVPRPDVSATSNHGFSFAIPRAWHDDGKHKLFAYAIDANDGSLHHLSGSHKEFKLSVPPVGLLESVDENGNVKGWMYDPYGFDSDFSWPKFVYLYLDGKKEEGGMLVGKVRPGRERTDVNIEEFKTQFANRWGAPPKAAKGIEYTLSQELRGLSPRMLYAYAVREQSGPNDELTLLDGSPKRFFMPRRYAISFEKDYNHSQESWGDSHELDNIPRGGTISQKVLNLPNHDHRMDVILDGKEALDMNAASHGYPFNVPFETKYISVSKDLSLGDVRSFPLSIKLPEVIELGMHNITVKHHDPEGGVAYEGSFSFRVIPYELLNVTVPSKIKAGEGMTLTVSKIPPGINLMGVDAQATIESLEITSDWRTNGLSSRITGTVVLKEFSVARNGDGTLTIRSVIPPEAASVRKGEGEVIVRVIVKAKDKGNTDVLNALQLSQYDGIGKFAAKTTEGKNPVLTFECAPGDPELFFESYDWSEKNSKKMPDGHRYNMWMGDGSRYRGSEADRILLSAKNFGCFSKLSIEISGINDGKPFTISSSQNAVGFWDEKNPMQYDVPDSGWDGSLRVGENQINLQVTEGWYRIYNDVAEITIRVTDALGRSAETKALLVPKYRVRAVSQGEEKELRAGDGMRIWLKNFEINHKLAVKIDNESVRNVYVEKGFTGTFEGEKMEYTDDISVPTWLEPGEHTLRMEDVSDLDEKGKPKYRATTKFTVAGLIQKLSPEGEKKKDSDQKQAVFERKVEVIPSKAKSGERITLKMSNFSPGVLTARLTNSSDTSFIPIRLSGLFDYTDSSGSLTKQVSVPSIPAGAYTIVVNDIANQTAQTSFTVEALAQPPPPPPTPQPTPFPQPPQPSPTPLPPGDGGTVPPCPEGSTYSVTFKQCIQEKPQEENPYEGKPCSPYIPMYQQKGCIEALLNSDSHMAGLFSGIRSFFAKLTGIFTGKKASDTSRSPAEPKVGEEKKPEEKTTKKEEEKSAYAKKDLAGSFRCWSYNTGSSAGGGGITGGESMTTKSTVPSSLGLGQGCRLFAPIVLKEDGKYEMSKEKGTWKIQNDTVILSESKLRGPGKILEGGMQIRFEYDYNNSHHIITYLREGEAKKPEAGQTYIELTLQIQFPEGDYSADSVNTVTLYDKKTGEQMGETLAYLLDRSTIESYFSKRPPKIGIQTGRIYNVFVSSGFGGWQVGEVNLRGVTKDITKKILSDAGLYDSGSKERGESISPSPQYEEEYVAPQPSPQPQAGSEPQPQSGIPCNPNVPKYNQPGCVDQ